jgi:hypothetical protein
MRLFKKINLWIETQLRARRFASAMRPQSSAPPWISSAECFGLDSNPMSPIAAARVGWLELAGDASRFMARYALELQSAADSLEQTRQQLSISDNFVNSPEGITPSNRSERLSFAEQSLFNATERQRRALSLEREALCLLSAALRDKYGRIEIGDATSNINAPRAPLSGMTLLAYFVSIRRDDAVELLLSIGADPDAKCSDGMSALDLAERKAEAYTSTHSNRAAAKASTILALLESASMECELSRVAHPHKPSNRI